MNAGLTNQQDWLICETAVRWAPAIRLRLPRQPTQDRELPCIREVQTLVETDEVLDQRDISLLVLEASETNLRDLLRWLPNATERHPWLAVVACVDTSLIGGETDIDDRKLSDLRRIPALLREAGCLDVIETPFQVHRILEVGTILRSSAGRRPTGRQRDSIRNQLRSRLPWQS